MINFQNIIKKILKNIIKKLQ